MQQKYNAHNQIKKEKPFFYAGFFCHCSINMKEVSKIIILRHVSCGWFWQWAWHGTKNYRL